ncbi:compass complex subunit protein [Stemphylium lycopersici]|uniref:Compass complex subunit protein n=1 Tax=Stemphylium lycopersici TaxID=183478 RepID=A0A364NCE0_STELY|nr:compass complex subunit protein [Stemphylium lycopersici]
MAEPSPNPALETADIDPALTNGMAPAAAPAEQSADVEMADSIPTEQSVHLPPLNIPPWIQTHPRKQAVAPAPAPTTTEPSPSPATNPLSLQPTVQTQPPTPSQTAQQPAPPSAPTLPISSINAPTPTPASSRNSPHPSTAQAPTQPIPHGSPTRVYLNQHVTPHLLEAMKNLATLEPEKPLKWLSEYLAQKSAEIEGA